MFHRGLGEAHDMQAKARFRKPLRHEPAKNAPFRRLPEISGRGIIRGGALAGDDEHVPETICLAASEEAPQKHVGILLPQPVKIEPRVYRVAAACDLLPMRGSKGACGGAGLGLLRTETAASVAAAVFSAPFGAAVATGGLASLGCVSVR